MDIALYNLEPNLVNSAMMRVSTYHKNLGDNVELYLPILHSTYDKVYAFSLFSFTDKRLVKGDMIYGGTGFDITKKLPKEIERCDYDWSLYSDCDFSLVWFSIGCIRNCKFCVVRQKEGWVKSVTPKNLNPKGTYIQVGDNNFFANPKWREAIEQLQDWRQPVGFLGGVDIRLLDEEQCLALLTLKHRKQIHIAWDNPKENLLPKFKEIIKWIKGYRFMCYVLIGFDSTEEEDLYRVMELKNLKIDPFVMPYNKNDTYQKNFARWVNHKAIFKSVKWKDYKWGGMKKIEKSNRINL